MNDVKRVPRKLRDREVIMVDPQILRWREMMRKKDLSIGKKTAGRKTRTEKARKYREYIKTKPSKINFFD